MNDVLAAGGSPRTWQKALRSKTIGVDAVDAGVDAACRVAVSPPALLEQPILGSTLAELTGCPPPAGHTERRTPGPAARAPQAEMDQHSPPSRRTGRAATPPAGPAAPAPAPAEQPSAAHRITDDSCPPEAAHRTRRPMPEPRSKQSKQTRRAAEQPPPPEHPAVRPALDCRIGEERLLQLAGEVPEPRERTQRAKPAPPIRTAELPARHVDGGQVPAESAAAAMRRIGGGEPSSVLAQRPKPGPSAPAELLVRKAFTPAAPSPGVAPEPRSPAAPSEPATRKARRAETTPSPAQHETYPVDVPETPRRKASSAETADDSAVRDNATFSEQPAAPVRERVTPTPAPPPTPAPGTASGPAGKPAAELNESDLERMMQRILDDDARRHGIEV